MTGHDPNKAITRHHIIGKSLQDKFNVHDEDNITKISEITHRAIHTLFKMELRPKEQLEKFYMIICKVMSEEAKELVEALVRLPDHKFYQRKFIKGKAY